ncbi:hypothetical protein T492DRAFT_378249 [Pavlovales sp. CCMP2436]|nr:hypothetical protein T492DRAFT_378249 [Pavlovales sp. CCMP2436]
MAAGKLGAGGIGIDGVLQLEARLNSGCDTSDRLDSSSLQQEARALVPLATLHERRLASGTGNGDDERDGLLRQLLAWFKFEFFKWVSEPKCEQCGGSTRSIGSASPSADDLAGGAQRVELYTCKQCSASVRFPRYNDALRLLRTRRGRCGEWANAFTLFCRALDFSARYVYDVTDHVWTEVFSSSRNRWLHCDPCENKLDSPLIYSSGWKKKLSYVFAFGPGEAVDVINRYVLADAWPAVRKSRSQVSESYLQSRIAVLDTQRRALLPPPSLLLRDTRRAPDILELANPAATRDLEAGEAGGRETGSVEWRAARGELGGGGQVCV